MGASRLTAGRCPWGLQPLSQTQSRTPTPQLTLTASSCSPLPSTLPSSLLPRAGLPPSVTVPQRLPRGHLEAQETSLLSHKQCIHLPLPVHTFLDSGLPVERGVEPRSCPSLLMAPRWAPPCPHALHFCV
uniref:Uncharacterized protein n=1 Tax=Molossus molossus TaxID=27622 RepID=A0A7J8E304_MOLMO|nr:hypothetical protein HJG59_009016 [Molossus molossus]